MKTTIIAIAIALISTLAAAQDRAQINVAGKIQKASSETVATYKEHGMSGLVDAVQDCWVAERTSGASYCLYLDLAAKHMNDVAVAGLHVPPHAFFSPQATGKRMVEGLSSAPMSQAQKIDYVNTVEAGVNQSLDARLARR